MTFELEDLDGSMEAILFPQYYERYESVLTDDALVRVRARVEASDRGRKLLVNEVQSLSAEGGFVRPPGTLNARVDEACLASGGSGRLQEILKRYPGRDEVRVLVVGGEGERTLRLPDSLRVDRTTPGLHAELKEFLGESAVWV